MDVITANDVRVFLTMYLKDKLKARGREAPTELTDDSDIFALGLVDSLDLLELMSAIGEYCRREIDFEQLSPEEMTVIGPLCRFVSEQMQQP